MEEARAHTLGNLLKRHRLAAGLSQEELAARAGVSVRSISNIERGVPHRPRKDTMALLADALGLSVVERESLLATARGADARPAPPAPPAPPTDASVSQPWPATLPIPPTPLIGRDGNISAAATFLRAGALRLLTLSGPAGVGKTHLAIELARHVSGAFPDGVAFVDLSPLRDSLLVVAAIAIRLDVTPGRGESQLEALVTALRDKRLLLVLDNFEHVLPAAPLIADILARCQRIRLLVTSRIPLHIRGEQQFPVAPLPLADPADLPPLPEMAHIPSVALLLQRAAAVRPDVALTPANASTLAAICARLDGLPLAIELAAPRLRSEAPAQLLARLTSPLRVLVDGACDLPSRQQTLRRALGWSYRLLSARERAMFRRLAVFSGGFDTPAAVAVRATGNPDACTVEHCLAALAERSLLVQRDDRWHMLETVREFAAEQLSQAGDMERIRRRHAAHFRDLAERAEAHLIGAEQVEWLDRLNREIHNLRAALDWCIESQRLTDGFRLAGALWRFWDTRGHLSEGREWLDRLFAISDTSRDERSIPHAHALAIALNAAGNLAWRQSDHTCAMAFHERALAIRRTLDDRPGIAASLNNLGAIATERGEYTTAEALYSECLTLRRWEGNMRGIAVALNNLGGVATIQGQYRRAVPLQEECLALRRQLGDRRGEALALANLGEIARNLGDLAHAEMLCAHSLRLRRELDDTWGAAHTLGILADIALDQGNHSLGAVRYRESLALCQRLDNRTSIAQCLQGLARAAIAAGQPERAALLLAAAAAQRERVGVPIRPFERDEIAAVVASVRAALTEGHIVTLWARGAGMKLEEAIALALDNSLDDEMPAAPAGAGMADGALPHPLAAGWERRTRQPVTVAPGVATTLAMPSPQPPP